jgi:hypothetical protein
MPVVTDEQRSRKYPRGRLLPWLLLAPVGLFLLAALLPLLVPVEIVVGKASWTIETVWDPNSREEQGISSTTITDGRSSELMFAILRLGDWHYVVHRDPLFQRRSLSLRFLRRTNHVQTGWERIYGSR